MLNESNTIAYPLKRRYTDRSPPRENHIVFGVN